MRRLVIAIVVAVLFGSAARAGESGEIRFGLTAVVVRENLRFFDRWAEYLGRRIGHSVQFVQRKTYRDISDLLANSEVQVGWICGYPFVQKRDPEYLELLAVPVFRGSPLYRSYIIVPRDSPVRELEDLRRGVFAYSDPDSNSGYLVPRAMLARPGIDADSFFRLSFFTYSHAETVQAVADRVADAGAVDSYVWEFLAMAQPALTERTRIVARSEQFGFPPLVVRRDLDPAVRGRLRAALLAMADDEEGRSLLAQLELDRFIVAEPGLYDSIRALAATYGGGASASAAAEEAWR